MGLQRPSLPNALKDFTWHTMRAGMGPCTGSPNIPLPTLACYRDPSSFPDAPQQIHAVGSLLQFWYIFSSYDPDPASGKSSSKGSPSATFERTLAQSRLRPLDADLHANCVLPAQPLLYICKSDHLSTSNISQSIYDYEKTPGQGI